MVLFCSSDVELTSSWHYPSSHIDIQKRFAGSAGAV